MSNTYTERLEIEIWNMAEELDENEDFSKVIEFLNSKEGFQPFGKRLAVFIAKKLDLDSTDRKTLVQALNEACGKTGVDLSEIASDGTLRNWFDKDMRPKKGDDSRLSMFALAFALRLSVDDTKKLFHKIYLDRAFNYRNEKEVIYYFCLKNNKTWADAKRMIAEVENMTIDTSDHTQFTNVIVQNVDVMSDEKMLLAYIRENGHNFEKNNVNAKKVFKRFFTLVKSIVDEEEKFEKQKHGEKRKNKTKTNLEDKKLNNKIYNHITGLNPSGEKGTITFFKNTNLPKEIRNRFPEAVTFSKDNMTSEELRKVIILLFSFDFWYKIQSRKEDYEFDYYIDDLNNILSDCNYPKLYFGNPFDWLFMYCTYTSVQEDLITYYHRPRDLFCDLIEKIMK